MPSPVRITDVSPRDGLQNEPGVIPTAEKVRLVELLCAAGVDEVEVTSFVSPKWVPQLADGAGVLAAVRRPSEKGLAPVFSALVPNELGMQGVLNVNRNAHARLVSKVAVFTAASETFSKKNTNASIAETIERFRPVVQTALREGLVVRGYVSCVIACPFEGPIEPARVVGVAESLMALGVHEIDLGDTIGAGTAESVARLLKGYASEFPIREAKTLCTLHLHDTFGRAAECVKAALGLGVRSFDGAVGGLGGCPYASTPQRRAPGNISTELLVRTIQDAGYETSVDLGKLGEAAVFAREIVGEARERAGAGDTRGTPGASQSLSPGVGDGGGGG